MSDPSDTNWLLLTAYLENDCSTDERTIVEQWLAEDDEHRAILAQLRTVRAIVRPASLPPLHVAALQAAVSQQIHRPMPHRTRSSAPARPWWGGRIAAVAATVALTALGYYGATRSARDTGPERVYTTGIGQQATVGFPDGSTVRLAPMTTMRVRGRSIDLLGEAYFDVAHAETSPFSVRTGSIVTRVLGTTFNVRRYAGDREAIVAVTSGKVAVTGRQTVTVVSGAVGRMSDSTVSVTDGEAARYVGWTAGHLAFHDQPLTEVLALVSRWYGVRFNVPDSALANKRITTTVDIGSRTELMRILTLVLDVSVSFDGGSDSVITIQPRRGGPPSASERSARKAILPTFPGLGR